MPVTLQENYDVLIVGGGMVGATLACALAANPATSQLSVLVVETQPLPSTATQHGVHRSFDSRSTALSAASRELLQRFGLWDSVEEGACPIQRIHVSDQGRFGKTTLNREDFSESALGYVVENAVFGSALAAKLDSMERCQVCAPAAVHSAVPIDAGMRVEVRREESDETFEIDTKLLVIAEGGRSTLCDQLGIARSSHDYEQHALIANVALSRPHEGVAFERFTNTGPLALLPLLSAEGESRASLVWTLAGEEAQAISELDDEKLLARLQEKFGWRLGRFARIGARAIYPLRLQLAQEQVRPHTVLLGNVAHTLHPVAGQGMNLSLRDIDALVAVLAESEAGQASAIASSSLGSMAQLNRYLGAREDDQDLMVAATDGLTKLFSSDAQAKVWLRKAGLLSLELLPTLKTRFGTRAMGFD
jgi:2-octaprenyl-6-methoxyphenol hydroxylase